MSNRDLQILLVDRGLVAPDRLGHALAATRGTPVSWLERLILLGQLDEEAMCACVAGTYRLRRCARETLTRVPAQVIASLPAEVALEHRAVPIGLDADGDLRLAMVDPTDPDAVREIQFFAGRRLLREIALASDVAEALERHYRLLTALSPRVRGRDGGTSRARWLHEPADATA